MRAPLIPVESREVGVFLVTVSSAEKEKALNDQGFFLLC
jgi:hypothetical protein